MVAGLAIRQAADDRASRVELLLHDEDAGDGEIELRPEFRTEFPRLGEFSLRLGEAFGGLQVDAAVGVIRGRTGFARDEPVVAPDRRGDVAIAHRDSGRKGQDQQVVGVEGDRAIEDPVGIGAVAGVPVVLRQPGVTRSEERIEIDRLACRGALGFQRLVAAACFPRRRAGNRRPPAQPMPWRSRDRSPGRPCSTSRNARCRPAPGGCRRSSPCRKRLWASRSGAALDPARQRCVEGAGDFAGDVVLDHEQVADLAIVGLRPDLRIAGRLDQAGGDPQAVLRTFARCLRARA